MLIRSFKAMCFIPGELNYFWWLSACIIKFGYPLFVLRLLHVWNFKMEAKRRMFAHIDEASIMSNDDLEMLKKVPGNIFVKLDSDIIIIKIINLLFN